MRKNHLAQVYEVVQQLLRKWQEFWEVHSVYAVNGVVISDNRLCKLGQVNNTDFPL